MKKKLVSSLLKCSLIIIVSFAGGAFASFVMNHNDNIPNGGVTKTSKVNYNNITPTTKAVKKVQNSVVSVINYKQQESRSDLSDFYSHFFGNQGGNTDKGLQVYGEGSGVIYKKDGKNAYVVTNNHVIDGAKQIEIQLADGSKAVGKLVGSDTYSDLAVVKIPSDKVSNIAEFADSSKLNIGETAIAIGSPLGTEYANSVTQGIVSSLKRTVTMTNEEGQTVSTNAIQTDAAINSVIQVEHLSILKDRLLELILVKFLLHQIKPQDNRQEIALKVWDLPFLQMMLLRLSINLRVTDK